MPVPRPFTLDDFDYPLPPELIAQQPAPVRSAARLLDGRDGSAGGETIDRIFNELPALLLPGDLLVFNDTLVIKARLFGHKASGGAVEVLVERIVGAVAGNGDGRSERHDERRHEVGHEGNHDGNHEVWAHLRVSKAPRPGSWLRLGDDAGVEGFDAEVLGRAGPGDSLFRLRFPHDPLRLLDTYGHVPLPPYITHADGADDVARYQTVFAARPGAVAAPTAALHFDAEVLAALAARGVQRTSVTLHVGAGTFQPVRESIQQHRMHSERFEVNEATVAAIEATRAHGGRIAAVGTTTVRALETAARNGALRPVVGDTDIFITPGFTFRVVDLLLTNFHLPKSTLLMLVSAFAGHEHVAALYRHAVAQRYRFFSYGDAMLLQRAAPR